MKFHQCNCAADWQHLRGDDVVSPLSAGQFDRDAADGHGLLMADDGQLVGRCSLWWSQKVAAGDRIAGAIGHYAARDSRTGAQLLDHACKWLSETGCDTAVGPMDGDTWHSYRAVSEGAGTPSFLMEPWHTTDCASHFEDAGFVVHATYCSVACSDLALRDPRAVRADARLAEQGIRISALSTEHLDEQMRAIHDVTLEAFAGTPLYRAITWDAMRRLYEPLLDRLDPSLVLLACRDDHLMGFAFGYPDYLQAKRGEAIDTAILKTLAIRQQRHLGGLGGVLMARFHEAAGRRGMRRVIHALMYEENHKVLGLSLRYGVKLRRYGLFMRELA